MSQVNFKKRSETCQNIFVDGEIVGQYYLKTQKVVLIRLVNEAAEREICERCGVDPSTVTPPPPNWMKDVPDEFKVTS